MYDLICFCIILSNIFDTVAKIPNQSKVFERSFERCDISKFQLIIKSTLICNFIISDMVIIRIIVRCSRY